MSLGLMLLLLGAAALHAGWNAIVKSAPDQRTEVILVAITAAVMAGMAVPFLPLPAAAPVASQVTVHVSSSCPTGMNGPLLS